MLLHCDIWCRVMGRRRSEHFCVVLVNLWSALDCDNNTTLMWMLHHVYHWTVSQHMAITRLYLLLTSLYCLWQNQHGVERLFSLWVCVFLCFIKLFLVCFDLNQGLVHQQKLVYFLCLMEPCIVYWLISFKGILSAHLRPRQRSLCGVFYCKDWAEALTPPLCSPFQTHCFLLVFSLQSHSGVSSPRDGPTEYSPNFPGRLVYPFCHVASQR